VGDGHDHGALRLHDEDQAVRKSAELRIANFLGLAGGIERAWKRGGRGADLTFDRADAIFELVSPVELVLDQRNAAWSSRYAAR
jgi:hypothetical protein